MSFPHSIHTIPQMQVAIIEAGRLNRSIITEHLGEGADDSQRVYWYGVIEACNKFLEISEQFPLAIQRYAEAIRPFADRGVQAIAQWNKVGANDDIGGIKTNIQNVVHRILNYGAMFSPQIQTIEKIKEVITQLSEIYFSSIKEEFESDVAQNYAKFAACCEFLSMADRLSGEVYFFAQKIEPFVNEYKELFSKVTEEGGSPVQADLMYNLREVNKKIFSYTTKDIMQEATRSISPMEVINYRLVLSTIAEEEKEV